MNLSMTIEDSPLTRDANTLTLAELEDVYASYMSCANMKGITVELTKGLVDEETLRLSINEMEHYELRAKQVAKIIEARGAQVCQLEHYDNDAPWRVRPVRHLTH